MKLLLADLKECETQYELIKSKVELIEDEIIKAEIEECLFDFDIIEAKKVSKNYDLNLIKDLREYQRLFRIAEQTLTYSELGDKLFLELEGYMDMGDIYTAIYTIE